ncbi:mitotic checkpoint serine/threonine-protein kinase BUB1 beta [Solea solea]|uniref:mitotic checkpoint serine/threonine-protein kinase BUB1 beta n=1 Tax=Solea solea TaxID=90069 RepID=UPI00272D5140|nr:mitotic checkpoint serine/threonine-protein kinase BUB1 beta [Solea solea]
MASSQWTQREVDQSGGVELQWEGGARQISEYCKELLTRRGEELSLDELRAERYFNKRQKDMEERLKRLKEVKHELNQQLQEKRRLLELHVSQHQVLHDTTPASDASFHSYESQSADAQPAGNSELHDAVFLPPEEKPQRVQIQVLRPEPGGPEDVLSHTLAPPHKSDSQSLIGETSGDSGGSSPVSDQEGAEPVSSAGPVGGAVDPCDAQVRQRLMDLCDVTSCPGLLCLSQPLPDMGSSLQLGGDLYHIHSRVMDGGSFCVYSGALAEDDVMLKVDSCLVPWDFHQFSRLKKSLSMSMSTAALPQVSCFLFLNGCVTIYTSPPDQLFTELTDCDSAPCSKAFLLLQLVSQLHSCGVVHADLRPNVLACSYRAFMDVAGLFPVDWSSSVDLDLQREVTSVQQLDSAQVYISLGLLDPTSPPQLVDLVGVAETMHLLLTGSRMVLVKDGDGWTAETFSRDEPCNMSHRKWTMWTRFFRLLLNVGARSSVSVLSELKQLMSSL